MTKKATITNPGKMERTRMVRLQHQISIENALWAEHPAVRFRNECVTEKSAIQVVRMGLVLRAANTTISEGQILCE